MKTVDCQVKVVFRAPLRFVFSWCTDYRPSDAKLEKEDYIRRIIERTSRKVIFEDLDFLGVERAIVSLHPPDRWHMDNTGIRRDLKADYALSSLPRDRTQLHVRWKVWPKTAESNKLSKAERERSAASMWRKFAAALERDYKRARSRSYHRG